LQNERNKLAACPLPKQGAHYRQAITRQQKPAKMRRQFRRSAVRFLPEKLLSNGFTAKNRWSVRKASVYNARVVRIATSQQFLHLAAAAFQPRIFSGAKNQAGFTPQMWNRFVFWAVYANAPEQKLNQNNIKPFISSIRGCFFAFALFFDFTD